MEATGTTKTALAENDDFDETLTIELNAVRHALFSHGFQLYSNIHSIKQKESQNKVVSASSLRSQLQRTIDDAETALSLENLELVSRNTSMNTYATESSEKTAVSSTLDRSPSGEKHNVTESGDALLQDGVSGESKEADPATQELRALEYLKKKLSSTQKAIDSIRNSVINEQKLLGSVSPVLRQSSIAVSKTNLLCVW